MSLPEMFAIEMRDYIRESVQTGFEEPDTIVENSLEYFGDSMPEEADQAAVRNFAKETTDHIWTEQVKAQGSWPSITDCDRLDLAFSELESRGIVCRQNFSCCGNCGSAEIWDEIDEASESHSVRGYVFYHFQDTERAVQGDGLYLNYGSVEEGETAALGIANEIVQILHQQGLKTEWNGSWSKRISIKLDWKRRLPSAKNP